MAEQAITRRVSDLSFHTDGLTNRAACPLTKCPGRRRGTVLVESALLLPLFLLFVFGICEYGQFLMVRNLIDHAAREGARYAVVRADNGQTQTPTQDILDYVARRLASVNRKMTGLDIQVYQADPSTGADIGSWKDASFGESIAVEITGDYRPFTASLFFMPKSIPLTARSMMKCEAN